jgi:aryl sulfotransferase
MRRLAVWLGITVPDQRWPVLVDAAAFPVMRRRAGLLVPDPNGVLKDHHAFFRQGRSGAGRDLLTIEEVSRYHRRAAQTAPPDLWAWLHRKR